MSPFPGPGAASRAVTIALAALLTATGAVACSLGFDKFDPSGASADGSAGGDGSTATDGGVAPEPDASGGGTDAAPSEASTGGGVDAGCTGQQACLSQATTCGAPCTQTYQQCASMCGGNGGNSCRMQCKTMEQSCRMQCANACVMCTTTAGCPSSTQCTTAAQM